jgi:hypothetical protein
MDHKAVRPLLIVVQTVRNQINLQRMPTLFSLSFSVLLPARRKQRFLLSQKSLSLDLLMLTSSLLSTLFHLEIFMMLSTLKPVSSGQRVRWKMHYLFLLVEESIKRRLRTN